VGFFFSSRRRHTRLVSDWSSDVCSSDLVSTGGAPIVTLKYHVYGREMSVRTNWIESRFALLNGAPTFLTLVDRTPRPHLVTIVRSEERRVGKECRCRWWAGHLKKKSGE